MLKCAAISDVHSDWGFVEGGLAEGGDILFVAGDLTQRGAKFEIECILEQIGRTIFTQKIVIAGNHDSYLQKMDPDDRARLFKRNGIHYLEDELLVLTFGERSLSIYGTPWSPKCGLFAFQGSEADLARRFAKIPNNLDVLLTHSPPYGILDANEDGEPCGSKALRDIIFSLKPKLHLFGHIHEARGDLKQGGICFGNVSSAQSRSVCVPILFSI
ncbi:MAG: metallophosphoesterase [Oligoflexus sp.]|nr:metallophosphoesterase [Oligoflexus sp.]